MGVTVEQTRFLAERLKTNSDKAAAELAGVRVERVYQWKADADFQALYDGLASDGVKLCMEILRQSLGRAGEVVTEAMQAKDSRGKVDHIARMNAAKLAMQAHGVLKSRQVIEGDPDNPIVVVTADELHEAVKRAKGEKQSDN